MCVQLKQGVNCDDYKVLAKIKQATAFSTHIFYLVYCNKSGPKIASLDNLV